MRRPSRQVVVFGVSLLCAASVGLFVALSKRGAADLAFWYEPISEDARQTQPDGLSKQISADDMKVIEAISRDEIVLAFRAYPVSVVGRTAAMYRVRVVDRLDSSMGGAAESHVLPGLGGQGFINFRSFTHDAVAYAPAGATHDEIVAAIGRGIGRAAVHEFVHQLLGRSARIDDSTDVQSYEYGSAGRPEQYYGPLRWDIAAPLLRKRFGME